MITDYAGELVIEVPKHDPEFSDLPIGYKVSLLAYVPGEPLKHLAVVMDMKLHFLPHGYTTADLTFNDGRRETWLVVGIRERTE